MKTPADILGIEKTAGMPRYLKNMLKKHPHLGEGSRILSDFMTVRQSGKVGANDRYILARMGAFRHGREQAKDAWPGPKTDGAGAFYGKREARLARDYLRGLSAARPGIAGFDRGRALPEGYKKIPGTQSTDPETGMKYFGQMGKKRRLELLKKQLRLKKKKNT